MNTIQNWAKELGIDVQLIYVILAILLIGVLVSFDTTRPAGYVLGALAILTILTKPYAK